MRTCPRCHGTGLRPDRDRIPPRKCNKCDGKGEVPDKPSFTERDVEAMFNAPPAKFRGMVDTRVRPEDFECDPDKPNPASCPSSGCKHCTPISMAADPPGAIVDTDPH